MNCISTINKANNAAIAKIEAERTTHWCELPTGELVINVIGLEGEPLKKIIDAKKAKKFFKDLENHDGIKPVWQHRQAVCRKFAK